MICSEIERVNADMRKIDVRRFKNDFVFVKIEGHQGKSPQTVRKNFEGFSRRDVKHAVLAYII